MTILGLVLLGLFICFAGVVFIGPPYLPTLKPQVKAALDLLDLKPGQTMVELGCGDGVVLVAAAQRGWKVVGIELNPFLYLFCKLRTWRYRGQVHVRLGNYWNTGLWGDPRKTDAIFGFVLPRYMSKLDASIEAWRKGRPVRLASFAFRIPGRTIDKEELGVFLYDYK